MTDVLIIGGGLAGWRAAEAASDAGAEVTLVANGVGNSPEIHALNCPVRPDDSVAKYEADTLSSGHNTNDRELVHVLCSQAPALKDEFPFDRAPDGSYLTLQPLGSTVPRCVSINHAIGAWALTRIRTRLAGRVRVISGRVTSLESGSCSARAIVLATGGWCGKYAFSTNPPELQGDGLAMARKLGAATRDLDQVQYEPTVALSPKALRGVPVITTMLFEGATFRNAAGEEFLPNPKLNKDALSRAIQAEIAAGRGVPSSPEPNAPCGVWYDLTRVPAEMLRGKYGTTFRRYAAVGVDITREPILVAPAPHTALGGIVIDTKCRVQRTTGGAIPGLFAAGEVTGGLHGHNRLGGNAGTEVLVFGRIAGLSAAEYARQAASDAHLWNITYQAELS